MNKFQLSYALIVICLPKRCHAFIVINLKTRIKPERELYGTDGFVFLRPDDFSWTKRLAVYLCVTLDSEPAGSCLQSTNENNIKKTKLQRNSFFISRKRLTSPEEVHGWWCAVRFSKPLGSIPDFLYYLTYFTFKFIPVPPTFVGNYFRPTRTRWRDLLLLIAVFSSLEFRSRWCRCMTFADHTKDYKLSGDYRLQTADPVHTTDCGLQISVYTK